MMRLVSHMDFARADIDIEEGTPAIDKERMRRMSYWVKSFPLLRQAIQELQPAGRAAAPRYHEFDQGFGGENAACLRGHSLTASLRGGLRGVARRWGSASSRCFLGNRAHAEAVGFRRGNAGGRLPCAA